MRIVAPEGTHLEFTQRRDHAGRILQRFHHPDGTRENALALSGDRAWLWMSVRISSPRLPNECRYRLRYRRERSARRARHPLSTAAHPPLSCTARSQRDPRVHRRA